MKIPAPRLALLIEVKDDKLLQQGGRATLADCPGLSKTDEPGLKMRTSAYPLTAGLRVAGDGGALG